MAPYRFNGISTAIRHSHCEDDTQLQVEQRQEFLPEISNDYFENKACSKTPRGVSVSDNP